MTDRYKRDLEARNERARERSESARDIGQIPSVVDPVRRMACEANLRLALLTYFPNAFPLAFSEDHLEFIDAVEECLRSGGWKAQAMPRGSGKTTILVKSILLSLLFGWRRLGVIVGATDQKAIENLEEIRTELEVNDLLLADFPEVCFPIRKLERITRRAQGQTHLGEPTRLIMTADNIVFPAIMVPAGWGTTSVDYSQFVPSPAYGHCIISAGITGSRLRGTKHTLPSGETIRPEVVLIDDPQTPLTAASPSEIRKRLRIITNDIAGMAGPGKTISMLAAVTVIFRGDLADMMLDRKLYPDWKGQRCSLLKSMPSDEAMLLWDKYNDLRTADIENETDRARDFYLANFDAMNDGAVVSWQQRKMPNDVDALQSAMDLFYKSPDRSGFWAEYQNQPLDSVVDSAEMLTASDISGKLNTIDEAIVPIDADYLTAHVDIHDNAFYYAVCAWTKSQKGYVIEYGTYPKQAQDYYKLTSLKRTLNGVYGLGVDQSIEKGLDDFLNQLCTTDYVTESDMTQQVDLVLIDEGYVTNTVRNIIRRSEHRNRLRSAKGYAAGPMQNAMNEWKVRPGELKGDNWRLAAVPNAGMRCVTFDPNHWKTVVHKLLGAADGDPLNITLYGRDAKRHQLLADHLSAEFYKVVEGKGRRFNSWAPRPGRFDNHHLDNLVGCAVAASVLGCAVPSVLPKSEVAKKKRPAVVYHT